MIRVRPASVLVPKAPEPSEPWVAEAPVDQYEKGGQFRGEKAAPPPPLRWESKIAREAAVAASKAESPREGMATYLAVLAQATLPAADRAHAALEARKLALGLGEVDRAELLLQQSLQLQPDSFEAQRAQLATEIKAKNTAEVLRLTQVLLDASPDDLGLGVERLHALLDDSQVPQAYLLGQQLLASAQLQTAPRSLHNRVLLGAASAAYRHARPDEAVALSRRVLGADPENEAAHSRLAELVLPNFAHPQRPLIERHFQQANRAYAQGDYAQVRKLALQICALDPDEGLAHKLFVTACERLEQQPLPLLPALAVANQQPLIDQLSQVVARATVSERAGRVEDLFPDWGRLSRLQQATAAYSVLGYAEMIPDLLERGAQVRLVAPGTSLTAEDRFSKRDKKKAFGRHSYSGRGWAYRSRLLVMMGAEKLEAAARGKYNTLTHEFGHLVHYQLMHADQQTQEGEVDSRTRAQAEAFQAVEAHFTQASERRDGQSLLDAYSGTNVWEYWAQGAMAYLAPTSDNKENPARLYDRNPKLWQLVSDLVAKWAQFPPQVAAPRPPPQGAGAEQFSILLRIQEQPKTQLLGEQAQALWARLLRWSQDPQVPPEAFSRARRHVADLAAIQAGTQPRGFLSAPTELSADFDLPELRLQLKAELAERALLAASVEPLRKLYQTWGDLTPDAARQAWLQLREA